jgi:hypothetical protein
MLSVTSRYQQVERAEFRAPDGRQLVYLRRRFLPVGPPTAVLTENLALRPQDLTDIDRRGSHLLIPLPTGVPVA